MAVAAELLASRLQLIPGLRFYTPADEDLALHPNEQKSFAVDSAT